jgi:hypothetical protein
MTIESFATGPMWAGFIVFVIAMLALDLFVLGGNKAHRVTVKEAGSWVAAWVSLAFGFAGAGARLHRRQDAGGALVPHAGAMVVGDRRLGDPGLRPAEPEVLRTQTRPGGHMTRTASPLSHNMKAQQATWYAAPT